MIEEGPEPASGLPPPSLPGGGVQPEAGSGLLSVIQRVLKLCRGAGISLDPVHDEAEKLEHAISEEFAEKIFEALGRPTSDPHGHPIPARDGRLDRAVYGPVGTGAGGVRRHPAGGTDAGGDVRYAVAGGTVPNSRWRFSKAPFDGPLTVRRRVAYPGAPGGVADPGGGRRSPGRAPWRASAMGDEGDGQGMKGPGGGVARRRSAT